MEECQTITIDLQEYPDLGRKFNEYDLGCLSRPPGSCYPTIVRESFMNYLSVLEKDFPKESKVMDMRNRSNSSEKSSYGYVGEYNQPNIICLAVYYSHNYPKS